MQAMAERLAKLGGAFDFIKVTTALLATVTLGAFALLATQTSRIEGKVNAVSLKVAEMPDVFQRDIQASTDKLTALIGRQTGSSPLSPAPAQGSPVVGNFTSDQRSGSSLSNLNPSNSGDPRIQR